jgi:nucleoside-diphosphate-sugar epimerase
MIEIQSNAYNEQYGTNYICIIPTNIYGPYDNFNLADLIKLCTLIYKKKKCTLIKGLKHQHKSQVQPYK